MLAFVLAATFAASDSVTLCVQDAVTHAALPGTQVFTVDANGRTLGSLTLDARCTRLKAANVRIRRVGYRARVIELAAMSDGQPTVVELLPLTLRDEAAPTTLATQRVVASNANAPAARMSASTDVDRARDMGVGSTLGLLGTLPFASVRSARGETGVSLRGARREQVAITLDGMPLNDPATGIADVSDLPLAALGSATVLLGADPLGAGPGASGGVIALESAPQRVIAARAGSFGMQAVEGAWQATGLGAAWNASASHRRADNDFAFVNDAGASGVAVREHRVNNDERRTTVSLGVAGRSTQLSVFASTGERGMVGAANVRTYDADRARTDRVLMRGQWTSDRVQFVAGMRAFTLAYRDPTRPALDADSRALAGDAELKGRAGEFRWRAGGGADRVRATGGIEQARGRGFAVADYARRAAAGTIDLGARVDAIGAFGALPSFSLAGERVLIANARGTAISVGARIAQAVRVPTLYDLYFSSPQRLFVRTLRPERVLVDAEVQSHLSMPLSIGVLSLQASLVARDTRDAIVWFPGNFGWSPANVGMERLRGFETRASLQPRWGEFSGWLTLYDAVLTSGGLQIPTPYVSRVAGGAQVRASLPFANATMLVHAMGPRPYTAGPRNPAFELPSTTLCDVALSRRVVIAAVDALLSLSLDNATDVRWQSVRGFPSPGRSWAISTTLRHIPKS